MAISDAHRLAPWADAVHSSDEKWWSCYFGLPAFTGLKFTLEAKAERWPGVQALRRAGQNGLELNPAEGIKTGGNSGMQAINIAVQLGAVRVILLGYDMAPGPKGRTHFFGKHPASLERLSPYASFIASFQTMVEPLRKAGVNVVNCSRASALTCFERMPLDEALAMVAA